MLSVFDIPFRAARDFIAAHLAQLKHDLFKAVTPFFLRHADPLRAAYTEAIADRNKHAADLETLRQNFASLHESFTSLLGRQVRLDTIQAAAVRFLTFINTMAEEKPGALVWQVEDDAAAQALKIKLANVGRALDGQDLIPDIFFDRPITVDPSEKVH